jgi:hypothetical protein
MGFFRRLGGIFRESRYRVAGIKTMFQNEKELVQLRYQNPDGRYFAPLFSKKDIFDKGGEEDYDLIFDLYVLREARKLSFKSCSPYSVARLVRKRYCFSQESVFPQMSVRVWDCFKKIKRKQINPGEEIKSLEDRLYPFLESLD